MKIRTVAQIAFAGYPLISLGFIYVTWLVAYIQLSHFPVPYENDPKFIGGASTILHMLGGFYMIAGLLPFLAAALYPLFLLFPKSRDEKKRVLKWYLVGVVSLLTWYSIVRYDPSRAIEWYFD